MYEYVEGGREEGEERVQVIFYVVPLQFYP